jgi:hypothetical protein
MRASNQVELTGTPIKRTALFGHALAENAASHARLPDSPTTSP